MLGLPFSCLQSDHEKNYDSKQQGNVTLQSQGLETGHDGSVHRNLKSRHLQMIALGGCIGTGLFLGSGSALATGGPLGLVLGCKFELGSEVRTAGGAGADRVCCS